MVTLVMMMIMTMIFGANLIVHVVLPIVASIVFVHLLYLLGPLACAAISLWRMVKLNPDDLFVDMMNPMMAALNIFYLLIIFQGFMFFVLLVCKGFYEARMVSYLRSIEQLSDDKWGKEAIYMFLSHICAKCRKDPLSIKGMDLIEYAAELLDSESQDDYLYGARLLSAFIKKGKDVSLVLLPSSRHMIQKLVDSLWISSSGLDENTEVTELAATIVAGLAGHIDVARYTGVMRYISSLLQETYWNRGKQACHPQPPQRYPWPIEIFCQSNGEDRIKLLTRLEEKRQWRLMRDQKRLGTSQERRRQNSEGHTTTGNKLILQGLTILERLASNNDNRNLICNTPGLLPKITAPLYSETLTQDVKTKAWAHIVNGCLQVLYQLISNAGWSSRRLRHEIFSNDQALSNLKSILLGQGNDEADHHQELQRVAMKILTELARDLSINFTEETKKVLITKQLQLFLLANGDDENESAAIAGRAMVSLSANSESNSVLIMTTENGITGRRLTEVLDGNNITQKTIAAEIMANLCAHYNMDNMKEILTKVLKEIMSIKPRSQERNVSEGQNNPALGDEENQGNSVYTNNEESHRFSWMLRVLPKWCSGILIIMGILQQSPTEIEENSDQEREEQEAFLSLAQVICDKLDSADLDGAIQNAIQNENNAGSEEQRREAFVDALKTIIDNNRNQSPESLRIVKLCGQIAKSVMQCEQYVEIFRNKGLKSSLFEASEIMSELESCMLFIGTGFVPKRTVRPLFSEIEESFGQI